MSKRVVLGGLFAFSGTPMLVGEMAPVGVTLLLLTAVLFSLPWLAGRQGGATSRTRFRSPGEDRTRAD